MEKKLLNEYRTDTGKGIFETDWKDWSEWLEKKLIESRKISTSHKDENQYREILIEFMDSLRDYVAEGKADISQDDRESSEFVDIFLNEIRQKPADDFPPDEWVSERD